MIKDVSQLSSRESLFLRKYHDGDREAGKLPYEIVMVRVMTNPDGTTTQKQEVLTNPIDIRIAEMWSAVYGADVMRSTE